MMSPNVHGYLSVLISKTERIGAPYRVRRFFLDTQAASFLYYPH